MSDWASSPTASVQSASTTALGCTCSARDAAASAAMAVDPTCRITMTQRHTASAYRTGVLVSCTGSATMRLQQPTSTSVVASVWYPGAYRVAGSDADSVLGSLVPVNVPAPGLGTCTDR